MSRLAKIVRRHGFDILDEWRARSTATPGRRPVHATPTSRMVPRTVDARPDEQRQSADVTAPESDEVCEMLADMSRSRARDGRLGLTVGARQRG